MVKNNKEKRDVVKVHLILVFTADNKTGQNKKGPALRTGRAFVRESYKKGYKFHASVIKRETPCYKKGYIHFYKIGKCVIKMDTTMT